MDQRFQVFVHRVELVIEEAELVVRVGEERVVKLSITDSLDWFQQLTYAPGNDARDAERNEGCDHNGQKVDRQNES